MSDYDRGWRDALIAAADAQERLAHGPRALGSRAVAFKRLIFANWLRERAQLEVAPSLTVTDEAVEAAAREAFWTDDVGGHHKPGAQPHTWENIPEVGRENYRTMIRAAIAAALPHLRGDI